MPKISRTCRTPGCLQEGEPVNTGLRHCIYCKREMEVPDTSTKTTADTTHYGGFLGAFVLPDGDDD